MKVREIVSPYERFLQKDPLEFAQWLKDNFDYTTPQKFDTPADLERACAVLDVYAKMKDYLIDLYNYAHRLKRVYEREKKEKKKLKVADIEIEKLDQAYEDMIDREDAIKNKKSAIETRYNALNRHILISSAQFVRVGNKYVKST